MNRLAKLFVILLIIGVACSAAAAVAVRIVVYPTPIVSGDGERKIVCVGDSLTYAQGVMGARKTDSFAAILSTLVEDSTVVNYGLPNRTLLSTGNMPYTAESHYEKSLSEDADTVIIMLGSNDTKPVFWNAEAFKSEYREFIKTYMNMESSPEVYIMIPTAIFIEQDGASCDDATVNGELREIVKELGDELGLTVIDLYSLTTDHPEWFPDGLHPNADGNRAIAEEIARVIGK